MNHMSMEDPKKNQVEPDATLLDLLIVLTKHKTKILGVLLGFSIVSAAISFILPDTFKATARILPPQQAQSSVSSALAQLGGAAGMAASAAGIKNPNDLYIGMLKSRTVADRIIAKFDLGTHYETKKAEMLRKKLESNSTFISEKDGLISIEVRGTNPTLVAQLANGYIDELTKLTSTLAVTESSKRRLFYEQQLTLAKNNLTNAEVGLKKAINSGGVISADKESQVAIETIGRLRAQLSSKEIELSSMAAFVTPTHPDYKRIGEEIQSLKLELTRLQGGRMPTAEDNPANKSSGFETLQQLRDVKYFQMLYELLAKQYEMARLDEAKEPAIVQILDPAINPELPSGPKRAIIVLLSAFAGMLIGVIWAFISEARSRAMQSPHTAAKLQELFNNLRYKTR